MRCRYQGWVGRARGRQCAHVDCKRQNQKSRKKQGGQKEGKLGVIIGICTLVCDVERTRFHTTATPICNLQSVCDQRRKIALLLMRVGSVASNVLM